jgi:hypothetical protein
VLLCKNLSAYSCVCVWNIWTDVKLRSFCSISVSAGGQSHVCSWLPNKEGCIHDWYDSGTLESCIPSNVVQIYHLSWMATGKAQNRNDDSTFFARLPQPDTYSFRICTFAAVRYLFLQWFIFILEVYLDKCLIVVLFVGTPSFNYIQFRGDLPGINHLVWLHVLGFSFHRITPMIQVLSSVIYMVCPTWCHRPIWRNHLGECWRTEFCIYTF